MLIGYQSMIIGAIPAYLGPMEKLRYKLGEVRSEIKRVYEVHDKFAILILTT